VIGRRGAALVAIAAVAACADDPVSVVRAPATLSQSPAEVFAQGFSVALVAITDDGVARDVTLTAEARVSMRVYGATVTRASHPTGARMLTTGGRVTLGVHAAITQVDASGRVIGRIENPFDDAAGRARPTRGRSVLVVLGPDGDEAWRVWEAYQIGASGDVVAEAAIGFTAGTTLDALFAALQPP